jgi:ESF2/ABP1 family protein
MLSKKITLSNFVNFRYLPKFNWTHINERLVYENEVRKQRLKQEIDLAKKETNFYIQNIGKSNYFSAYIVEF